MSAKPQIPYAELAAKIVRGRELTGMTQAAFAAELGFAQQTVSRWEAGTHRPTVAQIPALAALLKNDVAELMMLAGYGSPVASTLSAQFPVEALDPATFEQFVADVVAALEPEADVQVQGSRGHKQDGADVIARWPDGRRWSFQCKRVERFGKADVEAAVRGDSVKADRAFLVLSKIASPGTLAAVERHKRWTIWDKQDLTRTIRTLPVEVQERLVDIYFRGQRMALLGRSEPGPWLTAEDYFLPFKGRAAVFSHDWSLVGRETEIAELRRAMDRSDPPVTLLVGPGGIGKTRLLKEAVQGLAGERGAPAIRFLSVSQEPGRGDLEALGRRPKILVIDDAHDRESIGLLIEYAAHPANRTRLLIATRPYAEQRIRNELGLYSIVDVPTVRVEPLEKDALKSLVGEVLQEFGGAHEWADAIRAVAGDSPLVAAMAARIVAREGLAPELARKGRELRQIILSRFTGVITGHLGPPSDAALLRNVLEILAIIQPFHIDDRRIAELLAAVRPNVDGTDVSRALRLLADGGVIYRRGQLYRLMPDLLGDFLIEESCIGADGRLTPFAVTLARCVEGDRLTQVLVNLGRMDWRRMDGDPTTSELLEPVWRTLRAMDDEYDSRIKAVAAVAYYQPAQAIAFVEALSTRGKRLREFGTILRRATFSPDHRRDALMLLWELGRDDERELNRHPEHPVRVLAELAGYDAYKPLSFIEDVADFAFDLLDHPDAWTGRYTPLDILAPLLSGQGMQTESTGRAISMSPFFVDYGKVAHLRSRLITRLLKLLKADGPKAAFRAAELLNNALRPPHGLFNSVPDEEQVAQYRIEFARTIAAIGAQILEGDLAAPTVIGLIRSLSWYAEYDEGPLGLQVREIFDRLPCDLDFRFHAAMVEGWEYAFRGQVPYSDWSAEREWLPGFIAELLAAYPDRSRLCDAFLSRRAALEAAGLSAAGGNTLIDRLIAADPEIGSAIIERSLADRTSRLRDYLGYAVGAFYDARPDDGRALIQRMLKSPEPMLRSGAARGMIGLRRARSAADDVLLWSALGADDPTVASVAAVVLRTRRDLEPRRIVEGLLEIRFDLAPVLFNDVTFHLCHDVATPAKTADGHDKAKLYDHLSADDVDRLLDRMMALPQLEGHWDRELLIGLTGRFGLRVAKFLLRRADLAMQEDRPDGFQPIGSSHHRGHLNLQDASDGRRILELTWNWLRERDNSDYWPRHEIADVVAAMFRLDSGPVVGFLESQLDRATTRDLRWIAYLLREAHHRFAFEHRGFVESYLACCRRADPALLKTAIDQLGAAAMSGMWSGSPGRPMPRDIQARDEATAALRTLSRLSPAYRLYKDILDHANRNIGESIADGEAMDAEE